MMGVRTFFKRTFIHALLSDKFGSPAIYCGKHISYSLNKERFIDKFSQFKGGSIDLHKDEQTGVAVLTINNPEKKNAFSGKMMIELHNCVEQLIDWNAGKALIVHGANHNFCSGGDLSAVRNIDSEDGVQMNLWMSKTLHHLQKLPLISVAVIEGKALGGGAEVCSSCDFRLMTEDSVIQFAQVVMGITTGWGGGTLLSKLIGPTRALHYFASGKPISSQEALNIGLVNGIISTQSDSLMAAHDWLKIYTKQDAYIIHAIKNIITHSKDLTFEESLAKERIEFGKVWGQPAHISAINKNIKHQ